jgi:hypothetical protein
MPDEPNRNVEEQLKSWAQKRREEAGAPMELHPATRKLLLDEVTRTYREQNAQQKREPKPSWLMLFLPKPVWALPLLVVTAIATSLLLPSLSGAKSKRSRIVELARQNEAKQSVEILQRDSLAKDKNKSVESLAPRQQMEKTSTSSTETPATPPPASAPVLNETASAGARAKEAGQTKFEKGAETVVRREVGTEAADAVKQQPTPPVQPTPAARGFAEGGKSPLVTRQRTAFVPAEKAEVRGDAISQTRERGAARTPAELNSPQGASPGKSLAESQLTLNQPARPSGIGGVAADSDGKRSLDDATEARSVVAVEGTQPGLNAPAGQTTPLDNLAVGVQLQDERRGSTGRLAYFGVSPAGQATQQFAQVRNYRVNFNSPPTLNVLNSFQLEQNGRLVRIVDADGSTYEGQIDDPQVEVGRRDDVSVAASIVEESKLKKASGIEADQNQDGVSSRNALGLANQYFGFRVAGTNRTLNQRVVFQGNLVGETNTFNAAPNGVAADLAPAQQAATQSGQPVFFQNVSQIQGTRIQGQATIGGSNRIEINAVPVSP